MGRPRTGTGRRRGDHTTLARHYSAHAADHEADAILHEQLADADAASPLADALRHYAAHSSEVADALRNLAERHEAMAMD